MANEPTTGDTNEEEGVVRSTGATQQEGYSPLLARLLDETMRDAEREKQSLDESIRQKEADARRKREEEAIARRQEIQKRVEEEQARRQALIKAAQGQSAPSAAEAPRDEIQTETDLAVTPQSSSSSVIPWVLCLLLAGGAGAIYMQFSGQNQALQGELNKIQSRVVELHTKTETALPDREKTDVTGKATMGVLGDMSLALDGLIAEEKAMRGASSASSSRVTTLEKELEETKATLKTKETELAAQAEAKANLEVELETLRSAKGAKRPRPKKKASSAPKPKKVNVNTDIFNPHAR